MNICSIRLGLGGLLLIICADGIEAHAQGTITFDAHNNWVGTNYAEADVALRLVVPQGSSYDYMGVTSGGGNTPQNGTPFMGWFRQYNPYNYVNFSLTNGNAFGLSSVDLADPISPSLTPVPIMFKGYKTDGTSVTNTFTTPGGGATTFLNYTFTSAFADGLTGVDILASRWAMDNLVFTIPEPSAAGLLLLGGGLWACGCRRREG